MISPDEKSWHEQVERDTQQLLTTIGSCGTTMYPLLRIKMVQFRILNELASIGLDMTKVDL